MAAAGRGTLGAMQPTPKSFPGLDALITMALSEDLGGGDVTAEATVEVEATATARWVAKQPVTACGLFVAERVFAAIDPQVRFDARIAEGQQVLSGGVLAEVHGRARSLLAGERTALNFVQRLSGTATMTRAFVDAAGGRCRIVDTRKTTPGLRALERYAVRCGGGFNHRNDLGSGVLIKENHIRCAGGVATAIARARHDVPHGLRIECEVTSVAEVREAIGARADAVLLDNMADAEVSEAVRLCRPANVLVEVSGGVTLERAAKLAGLGVDVISVGALTHSAPAADISMLVQIG
jgi:nicotinate-nucleotide pyrophosphorylase (carboxylating)